MKIERTMKFSLHRHISWCLALLITCIIGQIVTGGMIIIAILYFTGTILLITVTIIETLRIRKETIKLIKQNTERSKKLRKKSDRIHEQRMKSHDEHLEHLKIMTLTVKVMRENDEEITEYIKKAEMFSDTVYLDAAKKLIDQKLKEKCEQEGVPFTKPFTDPLEEIENKGL